jgi:hypothetical protein
LTVLIKPFVGLAFPPVSSIFGVWTMVAILPE